jgi:hypothetical protein
MSAPVDLNTSLQQASDDLHATQMKAQAALDAALIMVNTVTAFIAKLNPKWPLTAEEDTKPCE